MQRLSLQYLEQKKKTTTETDTTVKTTTKAIAEVSNPDFDNAVKDAT